MTDPKAELERLLDHIAKADAELADALEARGNAVRGLAKLRAGAPEAYFSLPRDADVIARAVERVTSLPSTAIHAVMTEVLSACGQLLAPVEVVYSGQEGGFGHLAALTRYGSSAKMRPAESFEEVLSEVARGQASFGILPFETSYDGAVTATLNALARSDLKICAEIPIRRSYHLLATRPDLSDVHRIYASSGAITACQGFLARRFPKATVIDTPSGMVAAEHAASEAGAAALATSVVARVSGLAYVERGIEDVSDLVTRYVAVGNDTPPRTGEDRTAIAIATHDAPGVLITLLEPFANRNLNVYRLETRPARGWEFRYLILLEVDGHVTERAVLAAIEELRGQSRYIKVLGSYPRASHD